MEAFCPRCEHIVSPLTPELLLRGECPDCKGQLIFGAPATSTAANNVIEGSVSMTFAAGSRIGLPFAKTFEKSELPMSENNPESTTPSALFKSDDLPEAKSTVPETAFPTPAASDVSSPSMTDLPAHLQGLQSDPEPTTMPTSGLAAESSPTPSATTSDFQLPSIDFSMPSFVPPTSTPGSPGAAPPADLPAHLQLPNFPDFDLPPIPGMAGATTSSTGEQEVDPSAATAAAAAASQVFGGLDIPADVQSKSAMPPPLAPPPRPPTRAKAKAPEPQALPQLPTLPSLGQDTTTQREVTLLGAEKAAEISKATKAPRMVGPILVVVILASLGGGAFWQRDKLLALLTKPEVKQTVLSKAEQAKIAFGKGHEAAAANKTDAAIDYFKQAIAIDANYADAHRSLAIVYAKTNQLEKAVEHYKMFYYLAPDDKDAPTVKKYLEDYEAAKAKGLLKGKKAK